MEQHYEVEINNRFWLKQTLFVYGNQVIGLFIILMYQDRDTIEKDNDHK